MRADFNTLNVPASATGFGGGKLILCGEHAVVMGHAALAMGIDLGITVRLFERPGRTITTIQNDSKLDKAIELAIPPHGFLVTIDSDLPIGAGMGSSAALSIALLRARAQLDGEDITDDELHRRAFVLEQIFHGNPSGLDQLVAARGGLIQYTKG